jgi:hypothetical protein
MDDGHNLPLMGEMLRFIKKLRLLGWALGSALGNKTGPTL